MASLIASAQIYLLTHPQPTISAYPGNRGQVGIGANIPLASTFAVPWQKDGVNLTHNAGAVLHAEGVGTRDPSQKARLQLNRVSYQWKCSGVTYVIERRDSLSDAAWIHVQTFAGDGAAKQAAL